MIIILILSILGFINAYYLHYQYKQYTNSGKEMYCLIGGKCTDVISSKYGTTLGVKNEIIGISYYTFLGIYLLVSLFIPEVGNNISLLVKVAATVATIFSLYLLTVQTMILKKLCSWCLIAISINLLIFYFLNFHQTP